MSLRALSLSTTIMYYIALATAPLHELVHALIAIVQSIPILDIKWFCDFYGPAMVTLSHTTPLNTVWQWSYEIVATIFVLYLWNKLYKYVKPYYVKEDVK